MCHLSLGHSALSFTYIPLLPPVIVLHKCFVGNWKFARSGGTAKKPFKGNNYGTGLCSFIQLTNILNTFYVSDTRFWGYNE